MTNAVLAGAFHYPCADLRRSTGFGAIRHACVPARGANGAWAYRFCARGKPAGADRHGIGTSGGKWHME
jgi:hypothetical protein